MKFISFLIKPASSLCNMRCRYCFYNDVINHRKIKSYGIMTEDTMYALINEALDYDDNTDITFAFQGGEPTLAGLTFFESFVKYVNRNLKNQKIHYVLQTNGILLNEEWCDFFKSNNFLIGVSLDGFKSMHNYFRKNAVYEDTFKQVFKSINMLKKKQVDFNILTVLTSSIAKHPQKLFNFYKANNLKYIQLIPCLPGLEENHTDFSLDPRQFTYFYKNFFDLWLKEYEQGNYISVILFDNLIAMFAGYHPHQCGMLGYCSPQYVIESNGDVFPCDFYVLDQYRCGNIKYDTITSLTNSIPMINFRAESRRECKKCIDCSFKKICNRNCKRLNVAYYDDNYCGYREFLEYVAIPMTNIAKSLT